MKKSFIIANLFIGSLAIAQDNHFSMFYLNPLPLSPANAGSTKDIRAVLHFKDQWKSLDNGFRTYNVCVDARLGNKHGNKKAFMGLGLNVLADQGGFSGIKTNRIDRVEATSKI